MERVLHNRPNKNVTNTTAYNSPSYNRWQNPVGQHFKNEQQPIKAGWEPTLIFYGNAQTHFWHICNIGCDTVWIHFGFPDAWIGPTTDQSNDEQELSYSHPEKAKEDSGIGRGIELKPGMHLQGDHRFDIWAFSAKGSLVSYAYIWG